MTKRPIFLRRQGVKEFYTPIICNNGPLTLLILETIDEKILILVEIENYEWTLESTRISKICYWSHSKSYINYERKYTIIRYKQK